MLAALPENTLPFASDAEYLDAEFAVLRARSHRLAATHEEVLNRTAEDTSDAHARREVRASSREAHLRAVDLERQEERLRAQLDARLMVHRADAMRPKLGLDRICEEARLSKEERLVLIAASVPGVSQRVAEQVFADVTFYGALSIADLCALLEPQNVGDWLTVRRLFRKDAPLRRDGLIVLAEPSGDAGPDTLLGLDARLSMRAWALLTGDAGIEREV